MPIKSIAKLILPPIVLSELRALYHTVRHREFYSTIAEHQRKSDTIFIVGNGPSLKEQLENSLNVFSHAPCLCVNYFVNTEYYEKIKPLVFMLMDPELFVVTADDKLNEKHQILIQNLLNKTTWSMDLVVPSQFRKSVCVKQLQTNKHLRLLFVNTLYDYKIYFNESQQFKFFNKNLISVPAQSVLNTAVYCAIFWRYKNIVIVGADTSWHKEIEVAQNTNQVYLNATHYYGVEKIYLYKDGEKTQPIKLHESLALGTATVLKNYWLLKDYAEFNGVSVYNASAHSNIDAFPRKKLSEVESLFSNKVVFA